MAMMPATTTLGATRWPRGARRIADAVSGRALPARALGLFAALAGRRGSTRYAVPDRLRADLGLPPVEHETRRYWEVR